jgi:hypothetical protein
MHCLLIDRSWRRDARNDFVVAQRCTIVSMMTNSQSRGGLSRWHRTSAMKKAPHAAGLDSMQRKL